MLKATFIQTVELEAQWEIKKEQCVTFGIGDTLAVDGEGALYRVHNGHAVLIAVPTALHKGGRPQKATFNDDEVNAQREFVLDAIKKTPGISVNTVIDRAIDANAGNVLRSKSTSSARGNIARRIYDLEASDLIARQGNRQSRSSKLYPVDADLDLMRAT